MEIKGVYEGFFLTCEAGTEVCKLKCFNKATVDTGSKCALFGIGTTSDNTKSNIESTVGTNFGVCAVKGSCDLIQLGEWENFNEDLYIGNDFLLKLDSKLPCTAAFIKNMHASEYSTQYGMTESGTKITNVTSSSSSTAGDMIVGTPQNMVTVQGTSVQNISIHETLEGALKTVVNSYAYMKYLNEEKIALDILAAEAAFLFMPFTEGIAAGFASLPTEARAGLYSMVINDLETRYDTYKKQAEIAENKEVKKFYKDLYISGMARDYGLPIASGVLGNVLGRVKVPRADYRSRDFSLMPSSGNFDSYNPGSVRMPKNIQARAEIEKLEIISRLNSQGVFITGGGSTASFDTSKSTIMGKILGIRSKMPNKKTLRNYGNMGYMYISVGGRNGFQQEVFAHSGVNEKGKRGDLGEYIIKKPENPVFKAKYADAVKTYDAKKPNMIYLRDRDAEYKLLNYATTIIPDKNSHGTIILFSEKYACPSCSDIIMEFRDKYENIVLEVITGQGELIKPKK